MAIENRKSRVAIPRRGDEVASRLADTEIVLPSRTGYIPQMSDLSQSAARGLISPLRWPRAGFSAGYPSKEAAWPQPANFGEISFHALRCIEARRRRTLPLYDLTSIRPYSYAGCTGCSAWWGPHLNSSSWPPAGISRTSSSASANGPPVRRAEALACLERTSCAISLTVCSARMDFLLLRLTPRWGPP